MFGRVGTFQSLTPLFLPPPPPPTVAKCFCPQRLSSAPSGSQPTEAEERRDEDSERHQDGEHQAAVVGRIWVRCSGARLDPGFRNCLGPFLPTVLASFAVLLLFLFFLVLLQTRVRLQLWHICRGKEEPNYPREEECFQRLGKLKMTSAEGVNTAPDQ